MRRDQIAVTDLVLIIVLNIFVMRPLRELRLMFNSFKLDSCTDGTAKLD